MKKNQRHALPQHHLHLPLGLSLSQLSFPTLSRGPPDLCLSNDYPPGAQATSHHVLPLLHARPPAPLQIPAVICTSPNSAFPWTLSLKRRSPRGRGCALLASFQRWGQATPASPGARANSGFCLLSSPHTSAPASLARWVQVSSDGSCRGVPARAGPAPPGKGYAEVTWALRGIAHWTSSNIRREERIFFQTLLYF